MNRKFALIPAAGSGSRFGAAGPKQYQMLAGRALICHAIESFAVVPDIAAICVVIAPDDEQFAALDWSPAARAKLRALPVGGASRHASVLNGLIALAGHAEHDDWVLVHDAARAGLSPQHISQLVAALAEDAVGGLLALPVRDTLKRADGSAAAPRVAATVEREALWQAQTPQMFRYGLLRRALESAEEAGRQVTDESSAVEALGLAPRLIPGHPGNLKVTYPEDLELLGRLIGEGERHGI